jgi:hypothetical protein
MWCDGLVSHKNPLIREMRQNFQKLEKDSDNIETEKKKLSYKRIDQRPYRVGDKV